MTTLVASLAVLLLVGINVSNHSQKLCAKGSRPLLTSFPLHCGMMFVIFATIEWLNDYTSPLWPLSSLCPISSLIPIRSSISDRLCPQVGALRFALASRHSERSLSPWQPGHSPQWWRSSSPLIHSVKVWKRLPLSQESCSWTLCSEKSYSRDLKPPLISNHCWMNIRIYKPHLRPCCPPWPFTLVSSVPSSSLLCRPPCPRLLGLYSFLPLSFSFSLILNSIICAPMDIDEEAVVSGATGEPLLDLLIAFEVKYLKCLQSLKYVRLPL